MPYDYIPSPQQNPVHVSNMPPVVSSSVENMTGTWIQKAGDKKFVVLQRYITPGGLSEITSVVCTINSETDILQGSLEEHLENPYGGSFSYNFQSSYGSSKVLSAIKTNNNSFSFLEISGSLSHQYWYKITSPVFGSIAFKDSASSIYVPSSDKFLLGIEGAYSFEGASSKYRIFSVSVSIPSVIEHGYSARFFPEGIGFGYPSVAFCSACGTNGNVVYFVKNSINQMTFSYINSTNLVLSGHFQCSDTTGTPLAFSADPEMERFVAIYKKDSYIKAVYGEINESSFVFGTPVEIAEYTSGNPFAGVAWINSTNAFTICFSHTKNSIKKFTILNCKASNFEIIPDYDNHKTYATMELYVSPCCYYDSYLNKVIIGLYGDGWQYMPTPYSPYVIITDAAIGDVSLFWTNKILHSESDHGFLCKKATITVIPGSPGKEYVPPKSPVPSKRTVEFKNQIVCKKVG